eukprot:EG_transcript_33398
MPTQFVAQLRRRIAVWRLAFGPHSDDALNLNLHPGDPRRHSTCLPASTASCLPFHALHAWDAKLEPSVGEEPGEQLWCPTQPPCQPSHADLQRKGPRQRARQAAISHPHRRPLRLRICSLSGDIDLPPATVGPHSPAAGFPSDDPCSPGSSDATTPTESTPASSCSSSSDLSLPSSDVDSPSCKS